MKCFSLCCCIACMANYQPHLKRAKALVAATCHFCNSVIQKGDTVFTDDPNSGTTDRVFCQKCSECQDENLLMNYKRPKNLAADDNQQPLS